MSLRDLFEKDLKDLFPEHEEPLVKRDENGKKIIPPVAYFVLGSATVLTVGLSLMMIPILKEAWKIQQNQIPSFIAHRHTATLYRSGREPAILIPQSVASSSSLAGSASEEPIASTGSQTLYLPDSDFNTLRPWRSFIPSSKPVKGKAKATAPEHPEWPTDPPSPLTRALARARLFNTREERRMYGVSPADPDRSKMPIDPEIYRQAKGDAWKALGIATAIVGTCATAGVWLTSKLMGVSTIEEFAEAMRGKTGKIVPGLRERMDEARREESEAGSADSFTNAFGLRSISSPPDQLSTGSIASEDTRRLV